MVCQKFIHAIVIISTIQAEWIRIPQVQTPDLANRHDHVSIDPGVLFEQKSEAKPLKYEDLEHIVGPGFEDELERFYERHKLNFTEPPDDPHSILIDRNRTIIKYNDPWSIYDQPIKPISLSDIENSEFDGGDVEDDDGGGGDDDDEDTNIEMTTKKPKAVSNTKKPTKSPVRFKLVKVKPKTSPTLSWTGFLKFLKDIQKSFVFGAARSIQDKVKMLATFRDVLLTDIEKRMKSLWPTPIVRNRRSEPSDARQSHMEFPSSEAALMTISFLTFAVFLIKLVLQVINTIKSKHYSYNSFGTQATVPTAYGGTSIIKENRNARKLSTSPDDIHKIHVVLNSIHT